MAVNCTSSGSYTIVQWEQNDQIDATSVVTLNSTVAGASAVLRLAGCSNTIGGLLSTGAGTGIVENASGTANVGTLVVSPAAGASYTYSGVIQNGNLPGVNGSMAFGVSGSGQQVLNGPNGSLTYSGQTTVNGGTLTLNTSLSQANIAVNNGTLNGDGTINFLSGNEIIVGAGGTIDASGGMHWSLSSLVASGGSPIDLLDYSSGGNFLTPATLNDLLTPASAGNWSLSIINGDEVAATPVITYAWNVDAKGNWSNAANWVTGIPNAAGGVANFLDTITAPRTVTVDEPVTVGTITFNNSNSYTLMDPTGTNSITMDNAGDSAAIIVALGSHTIAAPLVLQSPLSVNITPANGKLTISGAIGESPAGSGMSLAVNAAGGAGTLVLSGSNSFTGPVTVDGGMLRLAGGSALSSAVVLTVNGGAALSLAPGDNETIGALVVNVSTGTVALNGGSLTLAAAANNTVAGLTGAGTLIVSNASGYTTTLANNGAFRGNLIVNNGTIAPDLSHGGLGNGTGTVTLNGVYWGGINSTNANFAVTSGTTEFSSYGGYPTFTGNLVLGASGGFEADTGGGNGFIFNGVISGQGAFLVNAAQGGNEFSPMTIGGTAANALSGPTIVQQGTLALAKPDGVDAIAGPLFIGTGAANSHVILEANNQIDPAVVVTIAANSDLRLNGYHNTIAGLVSAAGQGGVMNGSSSSGASVLTIGGAGNYSFGGSLVDGGTGTLALVKSGNGTQVLGGASSYSGGTSIEAGLLQLGSPTALGVGGLTVNAGTLDLAGNSIVVASLGGAAGKVTNSAAAAVSLAINGAATTTFGGTLQNGAGTLALVQDGAGVTDLTGSNAYSGATIIDNGTLQAVNGIGLPLSSNLVLNGNLAQNGNGAVFQGSGTLSRAFGSGNGQIQWIGDGGFAANGGKLTVTISNGGNPLVWSNGTTGTVGFLSNGSALTFGSPTANNQVNFTNSIDLNGVTRRIYVAAGGRRQRPDFRRRNRQRRRSRPGQDGSGDTDLRRLKFVSRRDDHRRRRAAGRQWCRVTDSFQPGIGGQYCPKRHRRGFARQRHVQPCCGHRQRTGGVDRRWRFCCQRRHAGRLPQ